MPDQVSDRVKLGRAFAPKDRERLVDELLESLNEPAAAELNAAWETEIERRLAEYDRGDVQAIDAAGVFSKVRCRGHGARVTRCRGHTVPGSVLPSLLKDRQARARCAWQLWPASSGRSRRHRERRKQNWRDPRAPVLYASRFAEGKRLAVAS